MPEHTIAENLQRLVDAKTAIGNAITAKGGIVNSGDGLEEYPDDIITIPNTITQSGTLPINFISNGSNLVDWIIYGNSEGVGEYDSETGKYIIPIICGNTATNIYINSPLYENQSVNFKDNKTIIPTINGINTLDTSLTNKPSKINIAYNTNNGILVSTDTSEGTSSITFNSVDGYLIDYSINGNMEQSGTPTPQNPIQPQECGDKTGNLFYSSKNQTVGSTLHITQTIGNSRFVLNKDASQSDTSANIDIDITLPAGTYTLSVIGLNLYDNDYDRVFLRDDNSTIVVQNVQVNRPQKFTLTETTHIYRATVVAAAQSTYNDTDISIMLNSGSTALPYEPYGYKTPISSGGNNLFDESIFESVRVTAVDYRMGISLGVLASGTYTLTFNNSGVSPLYHTINTNGVYTVETISESPYQFVADGVSEQIIRCPNTSATSWSAYGYTNIMLNLGSTPLPYEPYNRITIPVYLGDVQTTRKIKKVVLDGTESIQTVAESTSEAGTYVFGYRYDAIGMEYIINYNKSMQVIPYPQFICSHFKEKTEGTSWSDIKNGECGANSKTGGNNIFFILASNQYSTGDAFKAYLAQQYANGTPVTVWYILATETTGIANEPIRKIGTYTDTISSINNTTPQIPTIKGTNILTVNTSLEPSNTKISYYINTEIIQLNEKVINENGTYLSTTNNLNGYSAVTVDVPVPTYINDTLESVNNSLEESIGSNI